MIIKGFFRNKITKVFYLILSITIFAIIMLGNFITYYQKIQDDLFSKRSIIILSSSKELDNELTKIHGIKNINRRLVFSPDKTYNTIVDSKYYIYDQNGNIISSFDSNEDNYAYHISWDNLHISNFQLILVNSDKKLVNKLAYNEIKIGLMEHWYDYYNEYKQTFLNKDVGFKFKDKSINFKLLDIYTSDWPEVMISEKLYNELITNQEIFYYTMDITSYNNSSQIINEINKLNNNDKNFNLVYETTYKNFESNQIYDMDNLIDILKIVSYIMSFLFLIIMFVVTNNILADLKKNILMERRFGYSKKISKFYILLRFVTLLLLSFLTAIILSIITLVFINLFLSINILLTNNKTLLYTMLFSFLISFFTIIIKKYWNFKKNNIYLN